MKKQDRPVTWNVDGQEFEGHAFWAGDQPRPGVAVCHAWAGVTDYEKGRAAELVDKGYTALCIDVYGKGKRGSSKEENQKLMQPLMEDRALLQKRLLAGLEVMQGLSSVDGTKMAAIGFCFGGLCALDIARAGAGVKGVASFHGLLKPSPLPSKPILAKVLAMHGYRDKMSGPEDIDKFCKEMKAAEVDWQIHVYGQTMHAFTNPDANDMELGLMYREESDKRSRAALDQFLGEVLGTPS